MKRTIITAATLLAFSVAPALAAGCCGGKGKASMCARDGMKGSMAMNHGSMKKKSGCCCDSMAGNMSKRG